MPLLTLHRLMPILTGLLLTVAASAGEAAPAGWQQPFSAVLELPAREPDRHLEDGPGPEQQIAVWRPGAAEEVAPLVVLLHGGCWLDAYDAGHVHPLASALAGQGYAVAAPEYRRVGQQGGGWPGTFNDVGQAIDHLAASTMPGVDPGRMVLVGHSAGGQLALWAAGRSRLQPEQALYSTDPFIPRAVIGLAAITDLAAYGEGHNDCQAVTPRLVGGGPSDHPERYAQASPAELGVAIPAVLLQGDQDPIVPPSQAKSLPGARVRLVRGAGHFDLIHPSTAAFDILLAELEKVMNR